MKRWAWLLGCLVLPACANPAAQADKQENAQASACRLQYPLQVGTVRARQACLLQAFEANPYAPPAETALVAQSVLWGVEVDERKATLDQFVAALAQGIDQVSQQEQQERAQEQANRAAAIAVMAGAMATVSAVEAQEAQPVFAPPPPMIQPPITTNCYTYTPQNMSCTSH